MSDVFESRWFKIAALFFGGINVAFSAWVFAIARKLIDTSTSPIDLTEAKWLWWFSLIWLILSAFFFLWCAWRLIFAQQFRVNVVNSVGTYTTATEGGFSPDIFATSDTTAKTLKKTGKAAVTATKTAYS